MKKNSKNSLSISSNATTVITYWLQRLTGFVLGIALLLGCFLKYGKNESTKFVIDYSATPGKIILITDGDSDLGYETSLQLLKYEANLILTCKKLSNCSKIKSKLLQNYPKSIINIEELDLSNFSSIENFSSIFNKKYSKDGIDVLINNAETTPFDNKERLFIPYDYESELEINQGIEDQNIDIIKKNEKNLFYQKINEIEYQMRSNYLGTFYLTSLLFPYLNNNSRIINHSNFMHYFADINYLDYHFNKDLESSSSTEIDTSLSHPRDNPTLLYSNTKLAIIQFTYKLNKLLKNNNNKNIKVIAINSGYYFFHFYHSKFFSLLFHSLFSMDPKIAALSQIYGKIYIIFSFFIIIIYNIT